MTLYEKAANILREDVEELATWFENYEKDMPSRVKKMIKKEIEKLITIAVLFENENLK